jgi:hypothetical protein
MYADDSNAWAIGSSLDVVRAKLKEIAAQFVCWARVNGLAVNALKTQLLVSSNSGKCNDFNITVDGKVIAVANEFNLLGVTYNRRFATTPHDESVSEAARQRASLIARLSHYLPRGRYLRQLAAGLVLGKINHALPAVAAPRLTAADGAANSSYKAVQKAVNDVARTITGASRKEHISIENLLDVAKMQSINAMVTAAVAMEAWKAFKSSNGTDGSRNPVGGIVFGSSGKETAALATRPSRATTEGLVKVPLRWFNTM